jgi:hypothetical protein
LGRPAYRESEISFRGGDGPRSTLVARTNKCVQGERILNFPKVALLRPFTDLCRLPQVWNAHCGEKLNQKLRCRIGGRRLLNARQQRGNSDGGSYRHGALLPALGGQAVVQAFTLKAFSLGAADISIGPLFVSKVDNHAMRVDAKDTTKFLAVDKNYVAT